MIGIITYLIIGAALYMYASVKLAERNPDKNSLEIVIRNWAWWVAMLMYMIVWPIVNAYAFYKEFKKRK